MNKKIPISIITASVSAITATSISQIDSNKVSEEKVNELVNVINASDHKGNTLKEDIFNHIFKNNKEIKGLSVSEIQSVIASNTLSRNKSPGTHDSSSVDIDEFVIIKGITSDVAVSSNGGCHENCHGSRSWR